MSLMVAPELVAAAAGGLDRDWAGHQRGECGGSGPDDAGVGGRR
ncbi:hypothetical protein BCGT_3214 [Mycobacterium tuberculosis variant bovis BCG str. ATCC 35743]|nr:hypothetical protein BCGT_3214 [Mycobacterium tuberculosis variant bovis BCG str. ATCC 35743]